ncbi:MAG: hypothetical protein LQ352_001916 [Teloschistes flavicans]|nr:MAG: hypothetical protein LQ352_001916 [Teloschistes flavicans]
MKQRISALEGEKDRLNTSLTEKNSELADTVTEVLDLRRRLSSAEHDSSKASTQYKTRIDDLELRVTELSLERTDLNTRLTADQHRHRSLLEDRPDDQNAHHDMDDDDALQMPAKRIRTGALANQSVSRRSSRIPIRRLASPSGPRVTTPQITGDGPSGGDNEEPWIAVESIRAPAFTYSDLPQAVFDLIRRQMDVWDIRRSDWADNKRSNGFKCAGQYAHHKSSKMLHGHACDTCVATAPGSGYEVKHSILGTQ